MVKSKHLVVYAMLIYIIFFLANAFFPRAVLVSYMAVTVIFIFILSCKNIRKYNGLISLALFSIGVYLLFRRGASLEQWSMALIDNKSLISLILSVPFLGIPLYYDQYQEDILEISMQNIKSPYSFYLVTSAVIISLGMFLNMAALPLVNQLMKKTSESYDDELFNKALTRGFSLNLLWSPNFISVATALNYLTLSWLEILPIGLLLALLEGVLLLAIEWRLIQTKYRMVSDIGADIFNTKNNKESNSAERKKYFKLMGLIFYFMLFINVLEKITGRSVITIMPLAAILAPFLLALFTKKLQVFKDKFKYYLFEVLPEKANEFILFTSIGFFGYALRICDINYYLTSILSQMGNFPQFFLILLLILIIVLPSLIGFHPIITIATISAASPLKILPLSEIALGGVYLVGYTVYSLLSPFSAVNLVVSNLSSKTPLQVSLKINTVFGLLFIILSSCLIKLF
ncbi:MAG: hypothetical protein PWR06_136 [Thermoanaerobacteraceae bacterium]|nr:hypothetical protein [Thermoanaerobacteraceae bacterium]